MKRSLATLAALLSAAVVFAQAPFTIVRPADGAKVRETVKVQIPKGSIPEGSYVGIYVGGKFVEATILNLVGKYYEYALDTKGKNIPDGPVTIKAVLYSDLGDRPRVVDESSVQVNVANVASIPVPEDGFLLRYKFQPSTELPYTVTERTSISTISENQARSGGRAAQLPLDADQFRLLYAIDNKYPGGDGLLRMQALPAKGKDYAIFRTVTEPEGAKYMDYEMHPLYMRITNTGREVFGSVPMYVPLEGTAGEPARTDLFAVFPLPSLPEKRVKPGDAWQSRIHLGKLNLAELRETETLTSKVIARGELLGVEWEMGHPCAKIKYSIAAGQGGRTGRDALGDDRVSLEQTVWFAMDRGLVLKSVLDLTRDIKAQGVAMGGPPAGGGAPMGAPGGRQGGGRMGGPAGRQGGGGMVGGDDRGIQDTMSGGASVPGQRQPPPGAFGPPGAAGRTGGMGNVSNQLVRIRQQLVMVLEK